MRALQDMIIEAAKKSNLTQFAKELELLLEADVQKQEKLDRELSKNEWL